MKQLKYRLPLLCLSVILLGLPGCAQQPGTKSRLGSGFSSSAFESLQDTASERDDSNIHESLWQRVFDMYALPTFEHEAIDREVAWFVKHPDYIDRVQERAGIYLHSIVEQMDQQDVPGEIALLPVVESAFRPEAYSPKDAAGLWQFIPSTGRMFGLKQNRWYDGRRDVYESTQAAIRYLKKLHEGFKGDWLLALAAYNAGEGTVSRAIKRNQDQNKPTDFWSLSLPQETKTYVPRLLAVARVFANAGDYSLSLRHIPNKATLEPVAVGPRLDLHRAASMAEMSMEELHTLNPGFSHGSTGPDEQTLLIPVEKSDLFKEQLAKLDWNAPAEPERDDAGSDATGIDAASLFHRVRPGESLAQIARQYGASAPSIRQVNHLSSNKLRTGTQLIIPRSEKAIHRDNMQEYQQEIAVAPSATVGEQRVAYTAHKGDTLFSVARQFGVGVDQVMHWNHLKSSREKLPAGKQLVIWSKVSGAKTVAAAKPDKRAEPRERAAAVKSTAKQSVLYTVRGGDTLFSIAKRFNVSEDSIRKWNTALFSKNLSDPASRRSSGSLNDSASRRLSGKANGLKPGVVLTLHKEG